MKNKLSTVVYAQGWLEGQIESLVSTSAGKQDEDPTLHLIATQMLEQWSIVSNALDSLIREKEKIDVGIEMIKGGIDYIKF